MDKSFEKLIKQTKRNVFFNANDLRLHSICQNYDYCIPIKKDKDAALVPFKGDYDIDNASYALKVADLFISRDLARKRLKEIKAVSRRFEILYDKNNIKVILDYAHHPTEIKVVLDGVNKVYKDYEKVCIFQPHRVSRLKDLRKKFSLAFKNADIVVLCPVYSAGEKIKLGFNYINFAKEIIKNSRVKLFLVNDKFQLAKFIKKNMSGKKIVIGMGAGTISNWMRELPKLI